MQPLARAPRALLASLTGIVFDVDDTITRDGRLEARALQAMWMLYDRGLRLIAVTGRPLGFCDAIAQMWPVHLAVGENGAGWVWREGKRLVEGYFDDETTRGHQRALLERIATRVRSEMPDVAYAADQHSRRCDLAFDVGETTTLPEARIAELVACIEAEGARASVSSVHAHAIAGTWDKAQGVVQAARAVLGLDLEDPTERVRHLFVGDSGNDAAAFEFFEVTVGVRNVEDHLARLPRPPRFVTAADRGEGFAELASAILEARAIVD